jgi:hypothetical protein
MICPNALNCMLRNPRILFCSFLRSHIAGYGSILNFNNLAWIQWITVRFAIFPITCSLVISLIHAMNICGG